MQIAHRTNSLRLLAVLPLLLVACSKESGPSALADAGLLDYVPADTPYVLAILDQPPQEVRDRLGAATTQLVQAYAAMFKAMLNEPRDDSGEAMDPETVKRVSAVIDELASMVTADGMPEAGIDADSKSLVYGVGLLPVARVTLSDPGKFEAALSRLEAKAGAEMDVAKLGDLSYRFGDFGRMRIVLAVIDDQLVAALVPQELEEDLLRSVLGLTPPQQSIADTGELSALADKYDFKAYWAGFFDVQRIAATFLDAPSGVNDALLTMLEHDREALSEVCREEIRVFAGAVPRIVTGYTDISTEKFRSNTVVELRNDLATGLQKITAPVPGLGQSHDGLLSFGMSFNIPALREFYAARLDAMEADPFECELFAEMQAGIAESRQALEQPLPPFANEFHGFLAVIDDIQGLDFKTKQPPTDIDMRFLISTGNAQGLVAMGAMFLPQIAALDLKPDSKPVKLELPPTGTPIQAAWIAMSKDAIALSVGEGTEAGLPAMLSARAVEPPPFMSMNMDAGRYYGFLGDVMQAVDQEDQKASPEMAKATADVMRALESAFDRISFDVQFTERGIEMPSTLVLAR